MAAISQSQLAKYDAQDMCSVYDMWPEIAQEAYNAGRDAKIVDTTGINHIVFAGMGGSGALGDYYAALLSNHNTHVTVVKGYRLPKTVDDNTLVVCNSVSGNTSETLTILKKSLRQPCRRIALSAGGKMREFCTQNDIPHYTVDMFHTPRASFVAYAYALLGILKIGTTAHDIDESISIMQEKRSQIQSTNLTTENPALNLAAKLTKIPLIYYPWGLQAAAVRFKNSLHENAKMHAMIEDVIEAGHNGIMSWEMPADVQPVFIQGADDNRKTKERWKIFEDYFSEKKIPCIVINSSGRHIMTKLVNLIYLLDYSTIYLAAIRGVNPTSTDSIKYIKERSKL